MPINQGNHITVIHGGLLFVLGWLIRRSGFPLPDHDAYNNQENSKDAQIDQKWAFRQKSKIHVEIPPKSPSVNRVDFGEAKFVSANLKTGPRTNLNATLHHLKLGVVFKNRDLLSP